LLHELAHVRRGDFAAHLLARTSLGLYWWNPLAWIAWREFLKEQERAADDLVLSAGAAAAEYAGHLLEIARTMQTAPAIGWAALAMARRSQLEGRLLAILDSRVSRKTPRRASAWVAALLAVAMVAPVAAVRAQQTADSLPADVDATIRAAVSQKNHQILENAAKAAEALQKYDLARKLMDSALAVRENVAGPQSVDYGVGLLKLGDLERRRGDKDAARDFYTKAAAVLGNRPEAATALIYLGLAEFAKKNFEQAIGYFERAKLVDSAKSGEATMWMAVVRDREGDPEQADALFRQALAVESPNSAEAATVMQVYAQFLEQRGREEEAQSMRHQVVAIRKAQSERVAANLKAASGANVYRIGESVTAPSLLLKIEPQYSDEARAAKLQGTEKVYAEIGPDGFAHNVTVVTGVGLGLDENGVAAVKQWKFTPGTKDGQPVTVAVNIEINFRLK
jgi:TonB family protein